MTATELQRRAVLLVHGSRSMAAASSAAADDRSAPSLPGSYAVTVKRTFPGSPDQVARVREFVRLVLGPLPVVDEAVLLASELATNAIIHTASGQGGAFDVAVTRCPSVVRVEVHDAGSHQVPMPRPRDHLTEEGRGVGLVHLMADRWGHSGDMDGRSVFFELCWQPPIDGQQS
jgi:anti-sigma regulatory factor (Ser/Thr protein kinase)